MAARVLIVDDSAFARLTLGELLRAASFEVVAEAGSGQEALRRYAETKPDLVTLDYKLPGPDGLAIARAMLIRFPKARIVMISSRMDESLQREAFSAGIRAVIKKPFLPDAVVSTLRAQLYDDPSSPRAEEQSVENQAAPKLTSAAKAESRNNETEPEQPYSDFLDLFFVEAKDHIEQMGRHLDNLRSRWPVVERLDDFIRGAHSLKGIAAMMGYEEMARLAGVTEETLLKIRRGELTISDERVAVLEEAVSAFSRLLTDYESQRLNLAVAQDISIRLTQPEDEATSQPTQHGSLRVSDRSKPLVLIVDDDSLTRHILEGCLQRSGYRVLCAFAAEEGLRLARQHRPSIAIIDLLMPGMKGIELARELRREPTLARLPLIMLTVRESLPDKLSAFDAGVDDYLTKPFKPDELVARVRAVLARSQGWR